MIQALLVSPDKTQFAEIENMLSEHRAAVEWAGSGAEAASRLAHQPFDLVVADAAVGDMTGLKLAETVTMKHPFSNVAVVSTLSAEAFHEASEGLGILMQLPPRPGREEAAGLLEHLKRILALTGKTDI